MEKYRGIYSRRKGDDNDELARLNYLKQYRRERHLLVRVAQILRPELWMDYGA